MAINNQHPDYKKVSKKWKLVRAIVDNDASDLIREVDPNDLRRNRQYKEDAILTNFTRLTREGLTGLVFRKPSIIQLPAALQYLDQDATGYNFGIEQLAQKVVSEVLETGRYGLLADFPQADQFSPNDQPLCKIKPYATEAIINWQYTDYGSHYKLSTLVLQECVDYLSEDFEWVESIQYRLLQLTPDGYFQSMYDDECNFIPGSLIQPLDYNGNAFDHIPFTFIGAENNDACCLDAIPLYDLAVLNLGHYKNSADVEETSFIAGQAVPVIQLGDVGQEDFKLANPNGVNIGSRAGITVGPGGDFKFSQVSPNSLPRELMKDKENQAAAIGARLIAPPSVNTRETAEGARIRYGAQNSSLYRITKNVGLGFEQLLYDVATYMMETPEYSEFTLNSQFYEDNADPNMLAQQIMLFDRQIMSANEVRGYLEESGVKLEDAAPGPGDVMQGLLDDTAE